MFKVSFVINCFNIFSRHTLPMKILTYFVLHRWSHARCDEIYSEEDCEIATDYGYHCGLCRSSEELPPFVQGKKRKQVLNKKNKILIF